MAASAAAPIPSATAAPPPPGAACPPEFEPGAESLRRRLARAQAVPLAERSWEVQAFLDGVALLRQARAG